MSNFNRRQSLHFVRKQTDWFLKIFIYVPFSSTIVLFKIRSRIVPFPLRKGEVRLGSGYPPGLWLFERNLTEVFRDKFIRTYVYFYIYKHIMLVTYISGGCEPNKKKEVHFFCVKACCCGT